MTIKFKRGTMTRFYMRNPIETDGYLSDNFGLYKMGKHGWHVLHLHSHLLATSKSYPTLAAAKESVNVREALDFVDWKKEQPLEGLTMDQIYYLRDLA